MYTLPKDTEITPKVLKDVIKENETRKSRYTRLEDYYTGEHPILKRIKAEALKNNKYVANHAEYITDLYVGYLHGSAVDYQTADDKNKEDLEPVLDAYKKQNISNLDSELGEDMSIYGRAFERIYANEESEIKSSKIDPRNCIVVYDNTMEHNPLFAVIYDRASGQSFYGVTVLTSTEVRTYNEKLTSFTSEGHTFETVPVIEYRNNTRCRGDFESVLTEIDAYNLLQSDRINDKEQLVEALLVLYGFELSPKQYRKIKNYRVMSAPPKVEGTAAEYLTKQLNETEMDVLRARIEADIHKISKTPNMNDENFAQNDSGVAIRYKLLPFEWATKKKERFFETSLKQRFGIYNTFLSKRDSTQIVPLYDLDVVFTRSLPLNDFETSQMIVNLSDILDEETALSLLSFVKDPSKIMERMKKQKEEALKLGAAQFGTRQPNDPNQVQDNNSNV